MREAEKIYNILKESQNKNALLDLSERTERVLGNLLEENKRLREDNIKLFNRMAKIDYENEKLKEKEKQPI